MHVIAIDVSKLSLDVLAGDDPRTAKWQKIENHPKALQDYFASRQFAASDWTVVMESTGDYHRTAALFFLRKGFTVKILNPILTKQFTNATIRKIKTDKSDAEKIFLLALAGNGDVLNLQDFQNPAKELMRLSHFLNKLKVQLKLKLQSVQTKDIAGEKAENNIMELIAKMTEIIEQLDTEVLEKQNEQRDLIDTIPGFSAKLSEIVSSECGDITKFKHAAALVAYAGLDPKVTQSGHSINRHGHITKRGSAFLRYTLFLAARAAWRHDPDLYAYYEKKRGEGRSFTEVMCMISRKLLHRVYAVVKEQRPYRLSSSTA